MGTGDQNESGRISTKYRVGGSKRGVATMQEEATRTQETTPMLGGGLVAESMLSSRELGKNAVISPSLRFQSFLNCAE
jgi:hypothetical protein